MREARGSNPRFSTLFFLLIKQRILFLILLCVYNTLVLQIFVSTNTISAICSKTANISVHEFLLVGETTMNIIKFEHAQN